MAVEDHINIIRRALRRNMLQPESQAPALEVANQRPLVIIVAISTHQRYRRSEGTQFVKDSFRTDIAQVPDLVRVFPERLDNWRKLVMRISQDKNSV